MWITRLSVDRPIAVLMAMGAILLLGIYAYTRMPVELDPPIALPVVNIATVYPAPLPGRSANGSRTHSRTRSPRSTASTRSSRSRSRTSRTSPCAS